MFSILLNYLNNTSIVFNDLKKKESSRTLFVVTVNISELSCIVKDKIKLHLPNDFDKNKTVRYGWSRQFWRPFKLIAKAVNAMIPDQHRTAKTLSIGVGYLKNGAILAGLTLQSWQPALWGNGECF